MQKLSASQPLEFTQSAECYWEPHWQVEQRHKRWTLARIAAHASFYIFVFCVLWLNDFR